MIRHFVLSLILLFGTSGFAVAQETSNDVELENRAREVGHALRCVICQNQSIEESDATLAADMRLVVRDRLRAGDTNEEVIAYMRDRYGDYVLLKPPFQSNTYFLWAAPFLLLLIAGVLLFRLQGRSAQPVTPLSDDEKAALDEIA